MISPNSLILEEALMSQMSHNLMRKISLQWTAADRKLANQDKRLKSIIISCLLNDTIKAVIKCSTTREMWNDLILSHEGPSETRDTKIETLILKFNAFKALEDVEEDAKSNSEFLADLHAEFHDRALLANQQRFYKRSRRVGANKKPMDKSNETCFACGKQGHFQKIDEGTMTVKAFMAIAEDEPVVGKTNARYDYTKVYLHYVEDQRKNLLSKFNSLKQELSSCKYELFDLKNTKTSSKVALDQLLTKQVPGNIVCALGGRGKIKETISLKDVVFIKGENSPPETSPDATSDTKSVNDNQEPLTPLPKLAGAEPIGISNDFSTSTELIQTSIVSDKTKQVIKKESPVKYVKKKTQKVIRFLFIFV
ncbi:retrovirus-related pol polyprotein from transposon TNT 1-94 [Tanacetum coccineum]